MQFCILSLLAPALNATFVDADGIDNDAVFIVFAAATPLLAEVCLVTVHTVVFAMVAIIYAVVSIAFVNFHAALCGATTVVVFAIVVIVAVVSSAVVTVFALDDYTYSFSCYFLEIADSSNDVFVMHLLL